MTLQSSWPSAVSAVYALLQSIAPAGVEVIDGEATTYVATSYLQVGGVKGLVQNFATLGNLSRDEVFSIECVARAFVGSGTQSDADTQCAALFQLVQNALQVPTNVTLSGAVLDCEIADADILRGVTDKGGRATECSFTIYCRSYLTE